nr:hypothetical protein [Tanacetum cinerariifolium]
MLSAIFLAVTSLFFWQWQLSSLEVGSSSTSGNSITGSGNALCILFLTSSKPHMPLSRERKPRKRQNRIKTGQKREAWRSQEKFKAVTVVQTPGSGISILLAVGTPSTGSGNLYCQWELSPGSGNTLCILFLTSLKARSSHVTTFVSAHPNLADK